MTPSRSRALPLWTCLLLLSHPFPSCPKLGQSALASDPYGLSRAPERVLLHKGHVDSSEAPHDLLGLSPKPSGGPGWEGAPLAGSMLELETEESGERGVTWLLARPMSTAPPTPNLAFFSIGREGQFLRRAHEGGRRKKNSCLTQPPYFTKGQTESKCGTVGATVGRCPRSLIEGRPGIGT